VILLAALPANAAPQFLTKWGNGGVGNGQFDEPAGVAVDGNGNVYVVDRFNDRVQKFSSTGVFMTAWGSSGSGNGQFDEPRGIAVDAAQRVYVADSFNARVQKFTASGAYLLEWGTPGAGDGQFSAPRAIVADPAGFIYVTDDGFGLKRVQKFTASGAFVTKWGSVGLGDGQFQGPRGIAVDDSGYVYVSDAGPDRIQKFSATGTFVSKFGAHGSGPGQLSIPAGLVWTGQSLWVVDVSNQRIQEFDRNGVFQQAFGSLCQLAGGTGCVDPDAGGPLQSGDGQFYNPQGIGADASGNLFVSDSDNDRVQKLGTPQTTGVADPGGPAAIGLSVFPNPARHHTRVAFTVPTVAASPVEAQVIDLAGRRVRVLAEGPLGPGPQVLTWDGTDQTGRRVPGGIYFVRITLAGGPSRTAKIVRSLD
jgi:DNA-binding beta-propeller fold protein YncE